MLNEMKSRLLSGKKKVALLACLILLPVLSFAQYTGGSYDGYYMALSYEEIQDSIPPAPVTDLQVTVSFLSFTSLTLEWTAPGDDGMEGTASYYDIRYSTSAISESNWAVAVQCTGEPIPQPAGSTETFIVGGLSGNTTYYFALKTADEVLNWSGISNCASGTTEPEVEMELIYDDLLKDGSYLSISPSAKYFVQFPQYPEVPYVVEGFAAYLRGYIGKDDKQYPEVPDIIEGSMSCFRDSSKDEVRTYSIFLYPDNGQGLPDTTAILDSTELNLYAGRWNYYPFDECIVTSPGDIWLCVVSNDGGGIGCDTSYPDGRSYRYSDGEYYQYNNLDFMVRLRIKGTILEHDVLVESIDNPYRYIAPAKHSAVPRATVKNAGANTETFTTVCLIDSAGINVYTAYQEVCNLQSNSVARVAFPAWSVGNENSIYHMTVYTELSEDLHAFNDTISKDMTASYTEDISYNLGCVNACMTFVAGQPSDVLGRITPSAYPAQIKQMRIFTYNQGGPRPIELRVYSDNNPADFYKFEPGNLKLSIMAMESSGYGYHMYDISDSLVVIDSTDGEAYIGYLYRGLSNVYLDDVMGFIYPERFGMRWAGGYSVEDDKDYIISAVVRYTEDGSLSGIVTEASSRAPITNAQIIIGSRIGYSNEFGEYLITDLPSGDNYTVSCDAADQGYNIAYAYNVEIIADDTTNVDFSLTSPSMIVEPGVIDTTIGTDDSLVTYITVSNDGNGPLDYSIITTGQSQNRGGKAEFSVSPKISNSKSINNSALIESNVSGWYTVANRPINKGNRLDEWYTYGDINSLYWITWPAPERVTYFNPSDFGLEYPFYITKLSHWFYEHPSYPWDDATFHFKVYAEDGVTLLYESGDIEAEHMVEIIHELSGPVAISSGGFYFGVAPVSSTGFPSSCADNVYTGDNRSYYGSPGNWTLWSEPPDRGEYLQSVYLVPYIYIWMTVVPASGTVEPGSTDTVAVTCYTTGVDPGTILNGSILFSSYPDVGTDTVNVTLTVVGGITGDFNSDGYVDLIDLQLFGDHWHFIDTDPGWDSLYNLDTTPDPQGHQIINFADLQVFGDHWHEGTPPKSIAFGKSEKGPNEDAGIRFDLDATTTGNQNQTSMDPPSVGDYISADVYAINVHNLDTYEFEVLYNPSQLDYITATPTNPITHEPNILTFNGGEALGWMIDTSTPGVLSIAYTLVGIDTTEAPEGEGLIADIVFQALTTEQDSLTFGNVYFCNSFGEMDIITDKGTANLPVNDIGFDTIFKENRLENYPNPFRAQTTIFYAIKGRKKSDEVELKIYNVRGQLVKTIEAKNGKTVWNAEDLSSGIYFYKISCGENSKINKMLLIK
ncbi:T9SS C-terminal target domain-containing protein [bacterium]|nr:MAG: T9SS C-terminal target domain-containing protein [bacterium]